MLIPGALILSPNWLGRNDLHAKSEREFRPSALVNR
jgi:hypothetical protein